MGKYTGIVVGVIIVVVGVIGLMRWWGDFTALLKATIPAMMIFAGAIAVIAGLSEMKDESAVKNEEKK